ncbi:MAG: hypothetical protein CSA26_05430 [Desulfobacterales bacterium]|nr:MAG: hypothetical protein CSA26_05430 [Desulfobacterales bacterium]
MTGSTHPYTPSETRHGRIIASCCLLLFLSLFTGTAAFSSEYAAEKKNVEQGIKKYRINIRRLQQGIKKQQEEARKTKKQERDLLAELQDIDTRLLEQKEKLRVLESRMNVQKELIMVKGKELNRANQEKTAVQKHLQKRIQAYYKMGNIGFINVTFSTRTLPELLNFHDSFKSLLTYDENVIATYRHTIDELERSVETMEIEEALLKDFIAQNAEEQRKIKVIKQEKEVLLTRIKTQAQLHQKAIAEMKQAEKTLTSSLQVLQKKDDLLNQTFLLKKGKMPIPVTGELVTRFNEKTTNRLGIKTISKGIAISAPPGTMVHAVHDGEIVFSGYLRGFGNSVIINHGYQYYTVTSRIEQLLVKKGQQIKENSSIGITGETATLINEGIYFEIRHGATLLNPLNWINKELLKVKNKT